MPVPWWSSQTLSASSGPSIQALQPEAVYLQEVQCSFSCQEGYYCAKSARMLWCDKMESDEPLCVCVGLTFFMCLDNIDLISLDHLEAAVKQITEIYNAASAAWLCIPDVYRSQLQTTVFRYWDLNEWRLWNGGFWTEGVVVYPLHMYLG